MKIEVSNLNKSYYDGEGHKLHILKELNFEIISGSTAAIVGASGTGKSTFMHTLGTLESIDHGNLYLDEKDLTSFTRNQAAKFRNESIGFIFQFHQLVNDFKSLENVMIPGLIHGGNTGIVKETAINLLEKVGLADRALHKTSQLSGGEQQRVAIARALINKPRIVLADEPTGNLDEETGVQVMDILLRLNREHKTTFIMITHNPSLASKMQFQYRMENGQLHLIANLSLIHI